MDTKNKIVKTAKVCKITSQVLYILSIVAFFTFTVLAIALPCTNAIKSMTKGEMAIVFSVLALYAFFLFGLLWNVQKFFEAIQQKQTPFCDKASKYLKKTAIFTLLVAVVPAIIGSILIHAIEPKSEFVFRVEIVGIVTGVILFLAGLFFKYGQELQHKDDETL